MFEHSAQAAWFLPQLTQLLKSPAVAFLPALPLISFLAADGFSTKPKDGIRVRREDAVPGRGPETAVAATVAITDDDHQIAGDLVGDRYAWRGYNVPQNWDRESDSQRELTLLAWCGSDPVGTMTMGIDGGGGLCADATYGPLLDAIRADGRTVCEFTRFAVAAGADSKRTLSGLFDLAYLLGRKMLGVTDAVVEVNPRHAGFYRRAFGFKTCSDVRTCERVNAPAVLLRLDVAELEERMRSCGASTPGGLTLARA